IFALSEGWAWLREGRAVLATSLATGKSIAAPVREPVADQTAQQAAALADASGYQENAPMRTQNDARAQAAVAVPEPAPAAAGRESETELPESVTLQLTREQAAHSELIHGTARVTFETGRRVATVHVAFGEPLAGPPEVQAEPRGELEVEIACAQALPHG